MQITTLCLRATKVALKNKVSLLLSAFCLLLILPFTQAVAQSPNCYRITFSDKNHSPYSVNRPEEFLSPRAIAKRERFNIPVIEQDLPVNPHYIDSILNFSSDPSQIISKSKWDNSVVIFYPETEDCHAIIDAMLNHFSFVIDTLPVAYYKLPFLPPDTPSILQSLNPSIHQSFNPSIHQSLNQSSSCDYDYGKSIDNIKLLNGHQLHKAGFCGNGMLICAIDGSWGGLDTLSCFRSLYENGQICGTHDFVPGVNNVYIGNGNVIFDDHGTATLSEMASCIEGRLVGTAPKANYFLIRTENPWGENLVEEDFYAQGAEIADSLGADVVTASLGYTTFDYEWQNIYTPADNNGVASIASRAASILAQKGVIVVNSAGNSGNDIWQYIIRPADAFNILAVGAVNKYGIIAPYSSYGPSADGRIKPDVVAPAEGAWTIRGDGTIKPYGGTSCASPLIAGLSACLWQALPQYSSLEIMDLIRKYANRYNNPDNLYGYGAPNFYKCYLDHYLKVPEEKISSVSVYPNPTTGELRIENGEWRINNVEVFDVYGRKLLSNHLITSSSNHLITSSSNHLITSSSNHLINIAHLQAGVYFVKIQTETGTITKKIIKY